MKWIILLILCCSAACTKTPDVTVAPATQFEVGDCLKFTGNYEYPEQEYPAKLIISLVHKETYVTYDFQDKELVKPIVLRFSTAQEFKKVQCNE